MYYPCSENKGAVYQLCSYILAHIEFLVKANYLSQQCYVLLGLLFPEHLIIPSYLNYKPAFAT